VRSPASGWWIGRRGYPLTEYLWGRHGAASISHPQIFDGFARILEASSVPPVARLSLIQMVGPELSRSPAALRARERYALALARTLVLDDRLRDNIIDVYLPNQVWIPQTPPLAADRVFEHAASDRRAAVAVLKGRPASPQATRLLTWLEPGPGGH
jgi:hypothetical protein